MVHAGWLLAALTLGPPPPVVEVSLQTPTFPATTTPSSLLLHDGASQWLLSASPPSKSDILLLRQAFAEFYGVDRNLETSEKLLSQVIDQWQGQPGDEVAGLYRVRGDCYTLLGDARKAIADYAQAIQLLQGADGKKADPTELPNALLGRARAYKSLGNALTPSEAQQASNDYKQALILSSREDWDTEEELLADGASRNPYAAWEWGSVLRQTGDWKQAEYAHLLAAEAFVEIGDKPRAAIARLDAGVDGAAAGEAVEESLRVAIEKTKGVEARDVALLQRVVAKEGEGRMALAALYWDSGQRDKAEQILGDACIRLEQLQADAASRKPMILAPVDNRLKFSMDDDVAALDVSCYKFKNPKFLTETLGWPEGLQRKVIKLETLR